MNVDFLFYMQNTHVEVWYFFQWPACKQSFLSCMAFSVYEVVWAACLLHSWFVYL